MTDNNVLIRSGEAHGVGWSRIMLYSGFNILPRSVVRRQTGFAARITRTLSDLNELMPASENQLNACLEVIRDVILQARVWGSSGDVPAEQLADLMDAVHNIPTCIQHWEDVGDNAVKKELARYDEKWPKSVDGTNGLVDLYEHVLTKLESRT